MQRRSFLKWVGVVATSRLAARALAAAGGPGRRPNILFVTVDDMSCDSVGAFGCRVPDTTPHVDRLAGEGVRFVHAHVQVANCVPSRNVMQTGRYPHTSGVEGFYKVEVDFPILPDVLKEHGYFVGVKGKVSHSSPYSPYPWDIVEQQVTPRGAARSSKGFHAFTTRAIRASQAAKKPFYLVVNISDPHKPFYGEERSKRAGYDDYPPSRVYRDSEIPIPGFLPDLPVVRAEVKQYYDSVRRADDCVGAVLQALGDSGAAAETVVMFLSDHGMPFPFAKTNIYHHSTHTPWIVRWPGRVKPGSVDRAHMVSAVDFMPTVLDIAGIAHPAGLEGRSFLPLLLGQKQEGRDWVIKEYNENAGGNRHPMRSVETRRYGYIFNPWSDGTRRFRTATQGTRTYKRMQELAPTDKRIAARLRHFDHRTVEELYDYEKDPDALHNLVGDPKHRAELERLRRVLGDWMARTKDPCLEAFRHRDDPTALEAYMKKQDQMTAERRRKRARSPARKGKARNILALAPPASAPRGATVTLAVRHRIPENLGEQLVHVTLKTGDGKRIERKVLKARGTGTLDVTFAVPGDAGLDTVVFAAFIGKDYPSCLQHVATKPVPVK